MDFKNTKIAFQDKSDKDLKRALLLFRTVEKNWLVKTGKIMIQIAQAIHFPIAWAIKPTLYKQFVGAETLEKCKPVTEKLIKSNIKSILDYSVEGTNSKEDIKNAFDETMRSIINASKNPNIHFAVFKPTALVDPAVLKKISFNKPISESEQKHFEEFESRMNELSKCAATNNIWLLIDAEDYWYQDAIDTVVENLMQKYNKEKVIVFNTLQMYRTDRLVYLENLINKARKENFFVGVKFVRGAYMEKERKRAIDEGYESPINATKDITDKMYNDGLDLALSNIDIVNIFSGTHNEDSNMLITQLMAAKNIANNDSRVYLSQLYGMSDHISYNLSEAGYNVAKYIPYGPVKYVAPYLIRRAEENTSVAGQTNRELSLITTEIERRKSLKS